jgi:hypothetical protein
MLTRRLPGAAALAERAAAPRHAAFVPGREGDAGGIFALGAAKSAAKLRRFPPITLACAVQTSRHCASPAFLLAAMRIA